MKGASLRPGQGYTGLLERMNYEEFLKHKDFVTESSGFDIEKSDLNPMLYDFQKDIVRWALKKGKADIFADCGLGNPQLFCQLSL